MIRYSIIYGLNQIPMHLSQIHRIVTSLFQSVSWKKSMIKQGNFYITFAIISCDFVKNFESFVKPLHCEEYYCWTSWTTARCPRWFQERLWEISIWSTKSTTLVQRLGHLWAQIGFNILFNMGHITWKRQNWWSS